ncbi:MAG TPA: hypothetical protein VFI91_04800 [Longimicrobiaceae bacterium]|nr:hypothetical protein [Longimicrobiaceae bacterium]
MIDINPPEEHSEEQYPFLDVLLRDALPEIKLALGDMIDRENARALPGRYARLLPDTLLLVTLRPDAAEALTPVATTVEAELTDSCTRHGSLYDRSYRVELRRTDDPDAPLFSVSGHSGHTKAPHADLPAVKADRDSAATLPAADPDATRIDEVGPPGWQPGRWVLLVRDENDDEHEAFRITDPFTTIGRRSDDPQLRTGIALSNVPHVSRRQLALLWEERDGAPGFRIYNLGLNAVHLANDEIPGAHTPRGPLDLDGISDENTGWLPPGVPLRIGDHGPTLEVEEVPGEDEEDFVDPDATVYE